MKEYLRRRLLSPVVIALCDSLRNDPQVWKPADYGWGIAAWHTSDRFHVVVHGPWDVAVRNHDGDDAAHLSLIERFVLRRAVQSWVTNYNSRKLMSNSRTILKIVGGEASQ